MEYDKHKTVRDFAERTWKNYIFIEQSAHERTAEVYEVTQLINSLLGLLVFPQQQYMQQIPETPLEELYVAGWPQIKMISGESECRTLRDLVRYLRNSIAHFNMEFYSNDNGELTGLLVWNMRGRHKNWVALMTLDDIKLFTKRFIEMLISREIV